MHLGLGKGFGRVDKERHDARRRQQLVQQFEPFRRCFFAQLGHTREIATWSAKAASETEFHRVSSRFKNDRKRRGFTRIFPALARMVLPQGVIDIDRNVPPNDVQLIGVTAKVLVRSDLHPEIVQLLLQTMVEVHGGQNIFQRIGEFPNSTDVEYPVAPAAIDFYKNGPSFMQRHLPLWLSVHAQRAIAVLVTAIALGFPLFRFLPVAYNWMTRRRLFYWYAQLKALEASFDTDPMDKPLTEKQAEIERIEEAVRHIRFPLTFSDQLYNLRSHIDIVRRKISSQINAPGRMAAE
jgi:hypothetical protein